MLSRGLMVVIVSSPLLLWADVANCGAGKEALRVFKAYDAMIVKIITVILLLLALLGIVVGGVLLEREYWGKRKGGVVERDWIGAAEAGGDDEDGEDEKAILSFNEKRW